MTSFLNDPLHKLVIFYFRYQEKLRVHSLRVMFVVEKTINRIDNEENAAKVIFWGLLTWTTWKLAKPAILARLARLGRCPSHCQGSQPGLSVFSKPPALLKAKFILFRTILRSSEFIVMILNLSRSFSKSGQSS